jgi:hypothetical protein
VVLIPDEPGAVFFRLLALAVVAGKPDQTIEQRDLEREPAGSRGRYRARVLPLSKSFGSNSARTPPSPM